ncbi:hypothetical protein ACIRSS_15875 [Amycolatopsis sp. NPDC101161]|uniref:hypothetical protein n=1 Tax=Amycolatopsis sp. NPDC101161 TaxID=3363940 RepID=UPI0037FC10B2
MTNNLKNSSKNGSASSRVASPERKVHYKRSDVLAVPVAFMFVIGLCIFVQDFSSLTRGLSSPFDILFFPAVPALLVALFGGVYLYRSIRRDLIGKLPVVVASIFSIALVVIGFAFLTAILGAGTTCPISSNPQQDCGQLNGFMLYVYVNNPIVYGLAMILAVIGSASFLGRGGKR